jgi:ribosomal protein S26
MKKYLLFSILFVLQCALYAQNVKVTAEALQSFQVKFPNAKESKWDKEGKNEYEVSFILNGNKGSANFTTKGVWIESEITVLEKDLAKGLLDNFKNIKKGAVITNIFQVVRADNKSYYEIECTYNKHKKEFKIDSTGKLI